MSRHNGTLAIIVAACDGDGKRLRDLNALFKVSGEDKKISAHLVVLCKQGRLRKTDEFPARYIATGVPAPDRGRIARMTPQERKERRAELDRKRYLARKEKEGKTVSPKRRGPRRQVDLNRVVPEKPSVNAPVTIYAKSTKPALLHGDPIITPATRVTRCAHGEDYRYTFRPTDGWAGEFTQQWQQLRRQA
jgi:hypothetical protein